MDYRYPIYPEPQFVYLNHPIVQQQIRNSQPNSFQRSNPIQEIDNDHDEELQRVFKSPTQINFQTNQMLEDSPKSLCQRLWWKILIGFICCILLAVAIGLPFLILNVFMKSTTTTTTTTSTTSTTATTSTTSTTSTTRTTSTSSTSSTTSTSTTSATTTLGTTVCSTTAITTTVTSSSLPSQCSTATVINDNTRNAGYTVAGSSCDQSGPLSVTGWYRFSGASGTVLASCSVVINRCSTQASGWYSGIHPSTAGSTTSGTVCYNWSGNTCNWSNSIQVTNCNGFYVYYLSAPPVCNLRYCTI